MAFARQDLSDDLDTLPRMPHRVTSTRDETLEDVTFLSGAALAHLHLVFAQDNRPHALLRQRLALRAAAACVAFSGHSQRAGLASSAEVDERFIQKQLGHASAKMTRRYPRRCDRFRVNLTKAAGLYPPLPYSGGYDPALQRKPRSRRHRSDQPLE